MQIWDIYLSVAAATNLSFYSGAGALTGNINLAAGGVFNPAVGAAGWGSTFTVMPGANFNVSQTGSAQISGWFHYSN